MKEKLRLRLLALAFLFSVTMTACSAAGDTGFPVLSGEETEQNRVQTEEVQSVSTIEEVPEYSGEPYVEINGNQPDFTEDDLTAVAYEEYSELDELGRCGTAQACVGEETMPTEERESISDVTPTGWENEQYDIVDGGYLYNRCHLIGYQLTGENANEENLITGTRYMNVEGMLPFEDMVAEYVHETENHVIYRVTPIFIEEDLVASGVQMEAESVEDEGEGVCFNVYIYNVQPQITIDYATGENWESGDNDIQMTEETAASSVAGEADNTEDSASADGGTEERQYVINENTGKFHYPECSGVEDIKEKNKKEYIGTREKLIGEGYEPCGRCKP